MILTRFFMGGFERRIKVLIAVLLFLYARAMRRRGVLR